MAIADMVYVDDTGYHYPDYPTVLSYFQDSYRAIYGADTYLEADSQDGQWVAVLAAAAYDTMALGAAVYNSYSPATAKKDSLSRNVKINGIKRRTPSYSSVDVRIVGQAGTTINDGIVGSAGGTPWELPSVVVVPPSGEITVTAVARDPGSIQAGINTVQRIMTPTRGWQSVTNLTAAAPGAPVETDPELRVRQSLSVALPSRTVFEGTIGAVFNIAGVTRVNGVDNDTNATDANGVTANKVALVVEGGDATAIANAIAAKKGPGGGTFGSTVITVLNEYGIPTDIAFGRPVYDAITSAISVKALAGYTTSTGVLIQEAVSAYINGLNIGGGLSKGIEWADAITAANSVGGGVTYKITGLTITGPGGVGTPDVPLAYNHAAQTTPAAIVLTVT